MLSKLERLSIETDGRYASDDELFFIKDYVQSFNLRLTTYDKIRDTEGKIVEQVQSKLKAIDPSLLKTGDKDLSDKWKRDTFRVLRHSAITVLLDDPDRLKDQFLSWFQTIMQAFGAEKSCNATYTAMQDVAQKTLLPGEAELLCSVLELNRTMLGAKK
jgi:hypothetical protein